VTNVASYEEYIGWYDWFDVFDESNARDVLIDALEANDVSTEPSLHL